jgi:uncharacterized membrane protein YhaH (DUF805 family)
MEVNLFSAEGRIRRTAYWERVIVVNAITILAQFMAKAYPSTAILYFIIIIVFSIFLIIQGIKRMHDVGKSGWYMLIPIYGLILLFTDSTPDKNEYGENPKEKNPQEDKFYNFIMTLLISVYVSCGIYALLAITNIING